jgi:branched-chain amino acid transport system permease protein
MIGAYVMFWLFTLAGISPLTSLVVAAPLMFMLGLLIFKLVIVPLERVGASHLVERSSLIAFFGILIVFQNVALVSWSADYRVVSYLQNPTVSILQYFDKSPRRPGISVAIIFADFF